MQNKTQKIATFWSTENKLRNIRKRRRKEELALLLFDKIVEKEKNIHQLSSSKW